MRAFRIALLSTFSYLFITCAASPANSINDDDNDSRDAFAKPPYADIPDERLIALYIHPSINNSNIFILELKPLPDGLTSQKPDDRQYWFGSDVFPVKGGTNIEAASFSGGPIGAYVECTIFTTPLELKDGVWDLADVGSDLGQTVTFSYGETVGIEGATGYFCSAIFYGDQNPGMKVER